MRLRHDTTELDTTPVPRHPDALVDRLLGAPLFDGIQREEIVEILSAFDEESFGAGHHMTRQGLRGTEFFVIVDGAARVLIDGAEVARLGTGDFFGEAGVLTHATRSATVEATSPMRCVVLPHRGLEALLVAHPQLGVNVLRRVLDRGRRPAPAGSAQGS